MNDWTNALDGGHSVDILYFDFAKAFDSVLQNCLISKLVQFADDVKMFKTIVSVNDCLQLQHNINLLYEWSKKWQLKFNFSKCYLLHLGKPHEFGEYTIDGNVINCDLVKDLEVQIDSKLKFHHCCYQESQSSCSNYSDNVSAL